MNLRRMVLVLAVTVVGAASATAQDRGQAGLVMTYPGSVGIIWHITEAVAVRPELSVSRSTGETRTNYPTLGPLLPASQTSTSEGWHVGIGFSGLFYVAKWDAVRTYVSPSFTYVRSKVTTSDSGLNSAFETTTRSYVSGGFFGAQYTPAKHFGLFATVGAEYEHALYDLRASYPATSVTDTLRMRGGLGAIVYF